MSVCTLTNPSPPCKKGFYSKKRQLKRKGSSICCYKENKAPMGCTKKNPSPPCDIGKSVQKRITKQGTAKCCYVNKKIKKSGVKKIVKKLVNKSVCTIRNPAPPCPVGKSVQERNTKHGIKKCCYVSKSAKAKTVFVSKVPKNVSKSKSSINRKRKLLRYKLVHKGNFTRVKYLQDRLKLSAKLRNQMDSSYTSYNTIVLKPITDNRLNFPYKEMYVHVDLKPIPKSQINLKRAAEGSFNAVWKTSDNLAYRINKKPIISYNDYEEALNEGIMTIRLSELGISPKIIDYFCAIHEKRRGPDCSFVQVTEYSKYGSLSNYMSKFMTSIDVSRIANETITLYQRMGNNYIFCTDVKSHNMIVTNKKQLRIIDFDNYFCASKESPFNKNINSLLLEARKRDSKFTKKNIIDGFFCLNILQVAAFVKQYVKSKYKYIQKNVEKYIQIIVDKLTLNNLAPSFVCSKLYVSYGQEPISSLKHYSRGLLDSEFQKNNVDKMSSVTYISLLYVNLKYGKSKMVEVYNKKYDYTIEDLFMF